MECAFVSFFLFNAVRGDQIADNNDNLQVAATPPTEYRTYHEYQELTLRVTKRIVIRLQNGIWVHVN